VRERRGAIRSDDVTFERGYDKWEAHGQAKTATMLIAVQIARFGQDAGVRAFSVHPGGIRTPLQRHLADEEMVAAGWIDEHGNVIDSLVANQPCGSRVTGRR
jgi:NAD(P)-dependent dehydrogenase (short-subunit alcohol dehydrogenase family)